MAGAYGYRSPTPNRGGRKRLLIATIVVIVLIVVNIATGGTVGAVMRVATAPVWEGATRVTDAIGASGFLSSRSSLEAQVRSLQNQLDEAQTKSAAFDVLQQRYTSLSQLVHLAQTNPGITAPVTSSVISSPYGTFQIGAGSAEGITASSTVLMNGGFVVGRIAQVDLHDALVQELFAPGVQTDVTIDGIAGVAQGQGGDARVNLPHGSVVSAGDPVIAPNLRAHPIGVVAHVDSNPANAQTIVYVSLPTSLSSLQFVYVTL